MQAKNKKDYILQWDSHINMLYILGLPILDTGLENYGRLQDCVKELKELVQIAADKDFKDDVV